jgi:hypothetical protein
LNATTFGSGSIMVQPLLTAPYYSVMSGCSVEFSTLPVCRKLSRLRNAT